MVARAGISIGRPDGSVEGCGQHPWQPPGPAPRTSGLPGRRAQWPPRRRARQGQDASRHRRRSRRCLGRRDGLAAERSPSSSEPLMDESHEEPRARGNPSDHRRELRRPQASVPRGLHRPRTSRTRRAARRRPSSRSSRHPRQRTAHRNAGDHDDDERPEGPERRQPDLVLGGTERQDDEDDLGSRSRDAYNRRERGGPSSRRRRWNQSCDRRKSRSVGAVAGGLRPACLLSF